MRQVQQSVAAVAKPLDVQQAVDLLLGVFSDPRVKNRIAGIIIDALQVHDLASSKPSGGAA
jgi:hypothetical protein